MILKTKENIRNCQIDIHNWILIFAIKQNVIFKLSLTEEQEKNIIKQTKDNGNFEKLLEITDVPF